MPHSVQSSAWSARFSQREVDGSSPPSSPSRENCEALRSHRGLIPTRARRRAHINRNQKPHVYLTAARLSAATRRGRGICWNPKGQLCCGMPTAELGHETER